MTRGNVVLMVAEKPSLAEAIAKHLSHNKAHLVKSIVNVFEYGGSFHGSNVQFKVTAVKGHVMSIDFHSQYQNWDTTDPNVLFTAPTVKKECNPKDRIVKHLQQQAQGASHLILWLDCDREGENICFEVIDAVAKVMNINDQTMKNKVYRAKFSAISAPSIIKAFNSLGAPDENASKAVDARQEVDLKVGVAFTRFQTRYFQQRYGDIDTPLISYGPCQTPTLNFCVERHQEIGAFQSENFWTLDLRLEKNNHPIKVRWSLGRVFNQSICHVYHEQIQQAIQSQQQALVTVASSNKARKPRPLGLNTVEMLKFASQSLGMGPGHAMHVAERLYMDGYLSYPRTESTAYPPGFDFQTLLKNQVNNPVRGQYTQTLIQQGFSTPKGGVDVGDHPPITPVGYADESMLSGDSQRLYDAVTRHFLASVSPDCHLRNLKLTVSYANQQFKGTGRVVTVPGWTALIPKRAGVDKQLPQLSVGEQLRVIGADIIAGQTQPPKHLSEAELIGLMESHGIGTDASIPVHITNIQDRGYVTVESGRRMVPTTLGMMLVKGYQRIDKELCKPQVRAHVEKELNLVAQGSADKDSVVQALIRAFQAKFLYFASHISLMDSLFEAVYSPVSSGGRALSKCGTCRRYMKLLELRPQRLYCQTCQEVLQLPQQGAIKLWKEQTCPIDGYELLLYQADRGGLQYILCPCCYNHPPVKDPKMILPAHSGNRAGMACLSCPHPSCTHSQGSTGVCSCPCCGTGVLSVNSSYLPSLKLQCYHCHLILSQKGGGGWLGGLRWGGGWASARCVEVRWLG